MKDAMPDPKQKAIQEAAWETFATYGFRKTSMDDIAKRAGMSRPAVYLHYRNKEDIFRSLVQFYYEVAADKVIEALQQPGTATDVLDRAFSAQLGDELEAMFVSPHGHELLDTGAQVAMDIKDAGEARLAAIYADWLEREAKSERIAFDGDARAIAETISVALKGIKSAASDFATVRKNTKVLAQLFGAGLQAP